MAVLLVTLLFSTAMAVSLWTIYATIQPRIGYMRALMFGRDVPELVPAVAARGRAMPRPASNRAVRQLRAAA
ncbi:hypothetical protein ABS767_14235 [Sphingomonas sp. ST-64]|uniref:Uncharacterized protein n=1 Tax=Sphingomonas plantiphila TaxID=3163295 RepID=A0ABW8YPA2_9SPHN